MSYETHWESKGVAPCGKCGADAEWSIANRVEPGAAWPLYCDVRSIGKCRACGATRDVTSKERRPLDPAVKWRIVVSWLFFVAAIPAVVLFIIHLQETERRYAREPAVGDEWTIETKLWPDYYSRNSMQYSLMKVTAVTAEEVSLGACDVTFEKSSDANKHCKTFEDVAPLARPAVPSKLASTAISDIKRRGDQSWDWLAVLGAFAIGVFVHAFNCNNYFWRNRRSPT